MVKCVLNFQYIGGGRGEKLPVLLELGFLEYLEVGGLFVWVF